MKIQKNIKPEQYITILMTQLFSKCENFNFGSVKI